MRKPEYKRCPRCELNFIRKSEKLCSVCQSELTINGDRFDDLDLELCPICKTNYIQPDEIMCSTCLKEHQNEDGEIDSDWEQYINREDEDYESPDEEIGSMASIKGINEEDILSGEFGSDDFDDDMVDDDDDFDPSLPEIEAMDDEDDEDDDDFDDDDDDDLDFDDDEDDED